MTVNVEGGKITYVHSDLKRGGYETHSTNSHNADQITWVCKPVAQMGDCRYIHVQFENKTTSCGPNQTDYQDKASAGPCTVQDGYSDPDYYRGYGYTIADQRSGAVAVHDAEVIAGNQSMLIIELLKEGSAPPKKQKKSK
jgi:hypothetical protein